MRIVFVLHSHGLGGAERHALSLMQGLCAVGHEVLFAGPSDSWLAERASDAGIGTAHLPMLGFYDIRSMFRLARIARRFKADLLHGHLTRGAYYAGIAARLGGIPNVATAHATNAGKHFGLAERIIAVSSAVREFLCTCGYSREKIDLVPHGLEVPSREDLTRRAWRQSLGIVDDEIVFGMVSRFVTDKGHDIALHALAKIPDIRARLLLVGDHATPWGQIMQQLAQDLGIADRTLFIGQQDDVFPFMEAMDVFLAPSRREALGLALIEAAGMGLPLLGSAIGGIPEIIDHEHNGMLLPAEDPDAWAFAMRRLAHSPRLRRCFGDNARASFLQRFSSQRMLAATEQVYLKALGKYA